MEQNPGPPTAAQDMAIQKLKESVSLMVMQLSDLQYTLASH